MGDQRLASERVILESPLSFVGSARRIWPLSRVGPMAVRVLLSGPLALLLISWAWTFVLAWYLLFGLFIVPWRLWRRGHRGRRRDAIRHREVLDAIERRGSAGGPPA
jgi:hypothetical protein